MHRTVVNGLHCLERSDGVLHRRRPAPSRLDRTVAALQPGNRAIGGAPGGSVIGYPADDRPHRNVASRTSGAFPTRSAV